MKHTTVRLDDVYRAKLDKILHKKKIKQSAYWRQKIDEDYDTL